jgi:hypothetical protein
LFPPVPFVFASGAISRNHRAALDLWAVVGPFSELAARVHESRCIVCPAVVRAPGLATRLLRPGLHLRNHTVGTFDRPRQHSFRIGHNRTCCTLRPTNAYEWSHSRLPNDACIVPHVGFLGRGTGMNLLKRSVSALQSRAVLNSERGLAKHWKMLDFASV